jgi:hypothetical protein
MVRRRAARAGWARRGSWYSLAVACACAAPAALAHHAEDPTAELPLGLMIVGAVVVLLAWLLIRIGHRARRRVDTEAADHRSGR